MATSSMTQSYQNPIFIIQLCLNGDIGFDVDVVKRTGNNQIEFKNLKGSVSKETKPPCWHR